MKLFYETPDKRAKLYLGDARNLEAIEDGGAQLVVTSPPYNTQRDYGSDRRSDRLPLDEYQRFLQDSLKEIVRILRPGGVLALNVPRDLTMRVRPSDKWIKYMRTHDKRMNIESLDDRLTCYPIAAWASLQIIELGLLPRRGLVWVKGAEGQAMSFSLAMGNKANPFLRPTHEVVLLASKDRYNRNGTDGRIFEKRYMDWLKDTWFIHPTRGFEHDHPCPFPEELPLRLIILFSSPGDIVIDPFVGSGTTCKVARNLGRETIGIDINPEYLEMAKKPLLQGILL